MSNQITVLIVDDHHLVRKGLCALLGDQSDLTVVGEASNGVEALEMVEKVKPDVILLDLIMPEMDGVKVIKEVKKRDFSSRIIVVTSFAEDETVFDAIKSGAMGYLLKDSSPQDLLSAIRAVYRGESSLHSSIALKLVKELHSPTVEQPDPPNILTERETEVLELLAQGYSNDEIKEKLYITRRTVATHVSNILSKLHLANRTQAALYALREGIASLEDS